MTAKAVDTTVISSSLREIRSVDLLNITTRVYDVFTTRDVHRELEAGFGSTRMEPLAASIHVVDIEHERAEDILKWLERRHPYLHRGELSSFLLAIVNFGLHGIPCYYVTDDGAMRKKARNILIEDRFIELLGEEPPPFQMTGTVGLLGRLFERGMIGPEELGNVIEELRNGTFRVSRRVLDHLRRMLDED